MPRREDDDVAPRPGGFSTPALTLVGGFALAAAATLAVFLTDNPQYLRIAVVAVAWAFVLAAFAAGRRGTDRAAAAARELELRRAYELELEREVAARHEYELELENELRRETEDSMRYELDALRGDIAALASLRDEVARVSELRGDLAALTSLRDEVARVAALRDDVASLNSLHEELGQLADLRADMGRLRAELTEQLSSEMLVERIVMRTQASRMPVDQGRLDAPSRALEGTSSWADDVPPRELTGGWPAVRLDEPRGTQQFEQVRVERAGPPPPVPVPTSAGSWRTPDREAEHRPWDAPLPVPPWETPVVPPTATFPAAAPPWETPVVPPTATFAAAAPAFTPPPVRDEPVGPHLWTTIARHEEGAHAGRHGAHESPAAPPTSAFPMSPSYRAADVAPARPAVPPPTTLTPPPVEPLPSPLEWLAARSQLDPQTSPSQRPVPHRRRRDDGLSADPVDPAAAPTMQRPAVPRAKPGLRIDDRGGYRVAVREEPDEPTTQDTRLAEILAENGVTPAPGGRRRRRYRDEDEPDDVLARVLGRN
ncbi:DUF6779 domain-containing protein [Blastococcus sp. CT_GayMR16]|uniref:DUF6779 domain-containing protein n=1 Tax=Blastococcus sp. CT_GayMR16 TaxID=2559607 RepID=UPI0010731BFB|nr:DUF6779 domain-containing protein [Blastococcus sp. CT_GayMR16]TFV90578.1 hypothetical protein E4P38_03945 [Blastococcus sp. CT_GayMR16]